MTPEGGSITSWLQPSATIIASLLAATLGGWIAASVALQRFRRERAFERQLQWYERVTHAIHNVSQTLEIAITFQRESGTQPDRLERVWKRAQEAHLELDRSTQEGQLFGSQRADQMVRRLFEKVQDVAERTDAFSVAGLTPEATEVRLEVMESLLPHLERAGREVALEARRHLKLDD